jgi:hypothetical protein
MRDSRGWRMWEWMESEGEVMRECGERERNQGECGYRVRAWRRAGTRDQEGGEGR